MKTKLHGRQRTAPARRDAGVLPPLPDLEQALKRLLYQIPSGRVTTYGTLALALGDRLAARWVGHYLLHHDHATGCPCHRVVRVDGALGGYITGGPLEKAKRLVAEGIALRGERVDRDAFGFADFKSTRPLAALRSLQRAVATRVVVAPPACLPRTVAGLDVSYAANGEGIAVYALVDFPSRKLVWHASARRPVRFPYIQSFLTFRELPLLLAVLSLARAADRLADVLLVDGSGQLHPQQIGLASHLGVTVDRPTIGITKSLLCGHVDLAGLANGQSRPIVDHDAIVGVAIKSLHPSQQVLYLSPGHHVDVGYCRSVVRHLLAGHRLPEPLYWADHLSRQLARGQSLSRAT
jgi:deoxyribonuclease V